MIEDGNDRRLEGDEGEFAEDSLLLRRYADTGSEAAFAELVQRRIGLVYAVALRHAHGHRHRAEDATQAVFTDLARKADKLARLPVLVGWLHRSAQFAAAGLARAEQRRQVREQKADTMQKLLPPDEAEPDWDQVRPILDDALNEMDERDRDAVLLRFFDGRRFSDIGRRLQLTENAARMRVERALEKLNVALARRGITSTTAALGVALGNQVGAATPAGLATVVTGSVLTQTAAGAGGWLATFMGITKIQMGIAGAVVAAGATGYGWQAEINAGLRREIAALQHVPRQIAALQVENQHLARLAAEVAALRQDDAELKQLAVGVAEAQRINAENTRATRQRENERNVQAEIERLNREGNALVEEFKRLTAESKGSSLTPAARAQAEAAAKQKLNAIRAKQGEVNAFKAANGVPAGSHMRLSPGETSHSVQTATSPGDLQYRKAAKSDQP